MGGLSPAERDVEDTWQDDERMAWVVAQEGRGLDLVLEILHAGDPRKDLLDNVLTYGRLGIPEYFVYDRRRQRVSGFRLPFPGSSRYEPIKTRGGTLRSQVLGLDLGMVEGRLRFSTGGSEILETREINERLNVTLDRLEIKAEAEAQRAEAEAAARVEAERRVAELEQRLAALLAKSGEG